MALQVSWKKVQEMKLIFKLFFSVVNLTLTSNSPVKMYRLIHAKDEQQQRTKYNEEQERTKNTWGY